jgi:outer membrane protein assembly factor BamB
MDDLFKPMKAGGQLHNWAQRCGAPLFLILCVSWCGVGADWPQYRGANHDATSADRIIKQWTGAVTNPVWRVLVTNCLGSFAVSGSRAFTQTRRGTKEVCVALSVTNGAELWSRMIDDATYSGGVGYDDGPRTTPTVDGDSLFVIGSYFKLYRLDLTDGAILWQTNLLATYGGSVIAYQNCASPLVEDGLIFINSCAPSANLMALRTSDASLVWRSQNEAMTHSTPVLATIQGVRQVIFATQSGLVSLDPATGNRLWKFNYPFFYSTSLGVSPVVYQDMVFVCGAQAYQMGSVAARVSLSNKVWTATQLWASTGVSATLASHWMTPVAYQGFLYGNFGVQGFDSTLAQLKCVDMRTGAVKWSTNNFGRGATILVGDHLVSITERGQLVLSQPNTNAYTEVGRFLAIPNYSDPTNKCWNSPAVADGRVYIRSTSYAACFDLSVPGLKLDLPQPIAADKLQLTVRTVNGTPLDSNRLAVLELRASADFTQSVTQWTRLTNSLVLSNGVVRIDNVDSATEPRRYFILSEPK